MSFTAFVCLGIHHVSETCLNLTPFALFMKESRSDPDLRSSCAGSQIGAEAFPTASWIKWWTTTSARPSRARRTHAWATSSTPWPTAALSQAPCTGEWALHQCYVITKTILINSHKWKLIYSGVHSLLPILFILLNFFYYYISLWFGQPLGLASSCVFIFSVWWLPLGRLYLVPNKWYLHANIGYLKLQDSWIIVIRLPRWLERSGQPSPVQTSLTAWTCVLTQHCPLIVSLSKSTTCSETKQNESTPHTWILVSTDSLSWAFTLCNVSAVHFVLFILVFQDLSHYNYGVPFDVYLFWLLWFICNTVELKLNLY